MTSVPSRAATVRLIALSDEPLDVAEVTTAVSGPTAGGLAVFVGTVRNHDGGRAVSRLEYTAHPSAEQRLAEVAVEIVDEFDVVGVAAVHRLGVLTVGDLAVISAVSASHRGTAFEASRALIDRLKERVPIWKHQRFADGSEEWVGTP